MQSIKSTSYFVHFFENAFAELNSYLHKNQHSKLFVLVDSNTKQYCLPYFESKIDTNFNYEVIQINAGEIHKNIQTCLTVWKKLTELNADRKSLLINLGGGLVTDLGGFVASTYKRGIDFINIPTTLLSMVDASVGSKTGVDLGNLKNLIGLFNDPKMVLIDANFLTTISERELNSGFAEVIKYGVTFDIKLWNEIKTINQLKNKNLKDLIYKSISIKNTVVLNDLKESNLRKILNFGHTIGHAIESYFLENKHLKTLTHGEAIAIGMVVESYISHKLLNFPEKNLSEIKNYIDTLYDKVKISEDTYPEIIELMQHDKKNIGNEIRFVLLKELADCKIDCIVDEKLIIDGLNYYQL